MIDNISTHHSESNLKIFRMNNLGGVAALVTVLYIKNYTYGGLLHPKMSHDFYNLFSR